MQPSDSTDVRDIIVENQFGKTVGFSAKHHHLAIKHSRLSDSIDFGEKWMAIPCSQEYWQNILPTFNNLREKRKENMLWRQLSNKHKDYYLPILKAFEKEIKIICDNNDVAPTRLLKYLLGKHDFYKIIKNKKHVRVQSFNFNGNLSWGRKTRIPKKLISAKIVDKTYDTIDLTFSDNWVISARIHNAESRIIPSLKFDIKIKALPTSSIMETYINI